MQYINFTTKNHNDKSHLILIIRNLRKHPFVLYQKLSKFVLIVNNLWLRDNNYKAWKSPK